MAEFHSSLQAAEHRLALAATVALAEHEAFEHIANVIEKQAKAEIGHYQNEAGPFAAWEELADRTKAERERQDYTENYAGLGDGERDEALSITHGRGDRATQPAREQPSSGPGAGPGGELARDIFVLDLGWDPALSADKGLKVELRWSA